jgi:hypothetical protein
MAWSREGCTSAQRKDADSPTMHDMQLYISRSSQRNCIPQGYPRSNKSMAQISLICLATGSSRLHTCQ